jgi:hypothetical protein
MKNIGKEEKSGNSPYIHIYITPLSPFPRMWNRNITVFCAAEVGQQNTSRQLHHSCVHWPRSQNKNSETLDVPAEAWLPPLSPFDPHTRLPSLNCQPSPCPTFPVCTFNLLLIFFRIRHKRTVKSRDEKH